MTLIAYSEVESDIVIGIGESKEVLRFSVPVAAGRRLWRMQICGSASFLSASLPPAVTYNTFIPNVDLRQAALGGITSFNVGGNAGRLDTSVYVLRVNGTGLVNIVISAPNFSTAPGPLTILGKNGVSPQHSTYCVVEDIGEGQ